VADRNEKIAIIIAEAEREAYARGVRDTTAAFAAKATELLSSTDTPTPAKPTPEANGTRGRPSTKAITIVKNVVFAKAGLKGVDVVKAVHLIDGNIPERTVRSCLRRLSKNTHDIWQRDKRWYPKKKKEPENMNGEPVGSAPHS
jgi:hypothetical protein